MGPTPLTEAVTQPGGRRAGGDMERGELCALRVGLWVGSPTTQTSLEGSRKLRRQLPGTEQIHAGCAAKGNENARQETSACPRSRGAGRDGHDTETTQAPGTGGRWGTYVNDRA